MKKLLSPLCLVFFIGFLSISCSTNDENEIFDNAEVEIPDLIDQKATDPDDDSQPTGPSGQ